MEKLQAALAKARSRRADVSVPDRKPVVQPSRKTPASWDALKLSPPSAEALSAHRIVAREATREANGFDVLRTKSLLQMQERGWSRLAITSPASSSGKTTISCNLALGLGRQTNLRTILFDFDLGDPSVHTFFGITTPHNFSDVLSGDIPFQDHALRIGENVAAVLSPRPEPDPTQIIMSDKMPGFLDRIQKDYDPDIIIFDLPAIFSGDRARAFLKHTDCALIVAMADHTRFDHLDVCEREVAESTNVLGVVMNGCDPRVGSHNDL
ncbi:MAG: CpsD/CapB family tyrosine-protein kinase [Roseobacter sp.]|jgi:Mrp family chromosome partitioning ATPase|nr:CpsD/CapB family tyrosine-protein kinase [Roseobacter sp.]